MVVVSMSTYPATTKAPRRFNVLTKASDIQKRMAIPKSKTVWFPLLPVSGEATVVEPGFSEEEVTTIYSVRDEEDTIPPPPATHEIYPVSRKGQRAKRRFNVLTKPSVAKARRGKPARETVGDGDSSKTAWFSQSPVTNGMIFLPDQTLDRGCTTTEEPSWKLAQEQSRVVTMTMMPDSICDLDTSN